jgi:hypothetical protein
VDHTESLDESPTPAVDARWLAIFEDRYGPDSYAQLLTSLDRPCVTYAQIAGQFGVTRERVRQWDLQLRPGAPRGHQRQRLCLVYNQKRRLLEDPLFRSFYRHARPHFPPGGIELIPTRDGFRRRLVRVSGWSIAIKNARRQSPLDATHRAAYTLTNCSRPVDFVYYRLTPADYLLLPKTAVPAERTTFLDSPVSKYQRFKNTFGAFGLDDVAHVS